MLTLSEFTAQGVRRAEELAQSRVPSTSRGPVVVLKGWREGMDKTEVTLLLRNCGVPLAEAYDATNSILRSDPVSVRLSEGADILAIRRQFAALGVIL